MKKIQFGTLLSIVLNLVLVTLVSVLVVRITNINERIGNQDKKIDEVLGLFEEGLVRDSIMFASLNNQVLKIDTSQTISDSIIDNVEALQKEINYQLYNAKGSLTEISNELDNAKNASLEQDQLLQEQLSVNEDLLLKQVRPKLHIENVMGKAEFKNSKWVTRYSFSIKNYGGDIYNLQLVEVQDKVVSMLFPIPANGYLPYLSLIDVQTNSYELTENKHEVFLLFSDKLNEYYRQKLVFVQNNQGFRFDLEEMKELRGAE